MSARQVLIRALREQLGKGGGAVVAFAVGATATAGLAALTGPALASLDPASINDPIAPTGPLGGLHLSAPQVLLAAVALMLVNAASRYLGTLLAGAVQQRVVRDLRIHLHDHLLHLAPSAWAVLGPGELASRLGAEVASIRSLVHIVISHTFQHVLVAAALATLAIQLDTGVATFALAMAIPLAAAAWWLSRAARPATLAVHEAEARVAELAGEHGALVPLVRAYGAEAYASAQLRQAAEQSEAAVMKALVTQQRVGPSLEVLAAALSLGGLLWFRAGIQLPLTTTVSLFAALLLLMRPLQALASSLPAAYAGFAGLERLEQLLALPRVDAAADGSDEARSRDQQTAPLAEGEGLLTLRGVSFAYTPGQPVLHDITFTLRAGERVALTGRSGEGKSTLLMILAGLLSPGSGTRHMRPQPRDQAQADIAWVPQDSLFFADTLLANLAFGAPQDRERALHALRLVGLDALVAGLPDGLDTVLAGRGRQLSGGERQRLSVARGLYRQPRVLLLDEVTSALDAESEAEVLAALSGLAANGTALVFVSHRPTVAAFAERVLTLDGGRVVSDRAP
ncbi:MAG: ABC transporter ATP-binding protein [Sandaracinaceae bacterium]|nr:ABC transporter ATP-binding protein [Sandaracinaceae bacterium]